MYSAGAMVWLPSKQDIPSQHRFAADAIEEGCLNHPVLILAADPSHTEVIVLLMTSLGGKDLQERHPRNSKVRSIHIPIHPSNAHPDNGMRLHLIDNQQLPKNSYVKLKPRRTIKAALLRPWKHEQYQLSAKSLKTLMKHIGFKSPWPSTIYVRQPYPSPPPAHNPCAGTNYNRTIPAIQYTPKYQRPVGWASPQDQKPVACPAPDDWSAYLQPSHARIPLLQPAHHPAAPNRNEDNEAEWELLWVVIFVAVLMLLAWYFDMLG